MLDDFIDFISVDKIPEYFDMHRDKCQTIEFAKKKKIIWASIKQVEFTSQQPELSFLNLIMRMIILLSISEQVHHKSVTEKTDSLRQSSL